VGRPLVSAADHTEWSPVCPGLKSASHPPTSERKDICRQPNYRAASCNQVKDREWVLAPRKDAATLSMKRYLVMIAQLHHRNEAGVSPFAPAIAVSSCGVTQCVAVKESAMLLALDKDN
jgi:hypothetical protein